MTAPLVSVVMPVRDGEKYIGEALDSIASQQLGQLEVIVIDDGSRDASAEIAKRHPLLPQVLSQEPLGIGAALNRGIGLGRGHYLSFLDCDDVWPPGRLTAMLEASANNPSIDCVFGGVANTDAHLNPTTATRPARLIGALLIKRAAALRVGSFRTDITHAAIIDWTSRATALGLRFEAVDRLVLLRRIHGENLGILGHSGARRDLLRAIRGHHRRKQQ